MKGVLKSEDRLRDLWYNIKQNNIHHCKGSRREKRERSRNTYEDFSNQWKEAVIQVQEAQRGQNKMNPKRLTETYHN